MKLLKNNRMIILIMLLVLSLLILGILILERDHRKIKKETEEIQITEEFSFETESESVEKEENLESESQSEKDTYVEESTVSTTVEQSTEEEKEVELEAREYCIMVIGDSRACSLFNSMCSFPDWTLIKDARVGAGDQGWGVFKNASMQLVICEYGGGNLANGAYQQCLTWAKEVLNSEYVTDNTYVSIFNIFGLGDVHSGFYPDSAGYYNEKGEAFAASLGDHVTYYQCTVGPMDEKGSVGQAKVWSNEMIDDFNTHFKASEHVNLYDFNNFLKKNHYTCVISDTDPAGVHYTRDIDEIIIAEFISIATDAKK